LAVFDLAGTLLKKGETLQDITTNTRRVKISGISMGKRIHFYFPGKDMDTVNVTVKQYRSTTRVAIVKYNTQYNTSRVQAEPKRDHLPHALTFLCSPDFKCTSTCTAFRHVGALERTELFRNVQRVCMPALAIANIMLGRKHHQLCKIASACAGCGADSHGRVSPGVRMERKCPFA
jgi:hypothetical protein